MKKIKPFSHLQNKYRIRFWLTIPLFVLIFNGIAQSKSDFNELVSLNIRNAPLIEVLDNVSRTSGYEFIIDEIWDDLSITVTFEAIPLDQALKRILTNVNHAIVYKSDRKVLIRIYENDATVTRHNGSSEINRISHRTAFQSREIERPTSPNSIPLQSAEEAESEEDESEADESEEVDSEEDESEEDESEEAESEEPELSSRQPESSDEESEDKDNDASSDENSEAEEHN